EVELIRSDAQGATGVASDIPSLPGRLPGFEPERSIDPQPTDTGDVRTPVSVDRRQPAGVAVGPAGSRSLREPSLESSSDLWPFDQRRAIGTVQIDCFHSRHDIRTPQNSSDTVPGDVLAARPRRTMDP